MFIRERGGHWAPAWDPSVRRRRVQLPALLVLIVAGLAVFTVALGRLGSAEKMLQEQLGRSGMVNWKLRSRLEYERGLEKLLDQNTKEFSSDIVEPLREEGARLKRQKADLQRRARLVNGLYDIMTTSMTLSVRSSRLILNKALSPTLEFPVSQKVIRDFVLSEIRSTRLTVMYKEKNPFPIRPGWSYEGATEAPPENSPERLMRGALGTKAIYLAEKVILHDEPASEELHDNVDHVCLQLPAAVVQKIFDEIYVGTQLTVVP